MRNRYLIIYEDDCVGYHVLKCYLKLKNLFRIDCLNLIVCSQTQFRSLLVEFCFRFHLLLLFQTTHLIGRWSANNPNQSVISQIDSA
jgi:hypothetical protein